MGKNSITNPCQLKRYSRPTIPKLMSRVQEALNSLGTKRISLQQKTIINQYSKIQPLLQSDRPRSNKCYKCQTILHISHKNTALILSSQTWTPHTFRQCITCWCPQSWTCSPAYPTANKILRPFRSKFSSQTTCIRNRPLNRCSSMPFYRINFGSNLSNSPSSSTNRTCTRHRCKRWYSSSIHRNKATKAIIKINMDK